MLDSVASSSNPGCIDQTVSNSSPVARTQPPWRAPTTSPDAKLPPLRIYNSLTRSKTPFIPIDPRGRDVGWYACGPTVYDDAHLGHARNYVTSDIIRRILKDYFGFNVRYVMNVTDVDDKIILRARQQYLLKRHKQSKRSDNDISTAALKAYINKHLDGITTFDSAQSVVEQIQIHYGSLLRRTAFGDEESKTKMRAKTAIAAAQALHIQHSLPAGKVLDEEQSGKLDEVLMPYLDSLQGSTVDAKDHSIFTHLTKLYESRFTEDMRALDVEDPDEITRVTEYGAQIVDFVKRIEDNGFAYRASNGVFFDIAAFEKAKNSYARLEPWSRNDTALLADGEGALSSHLELQKAEGNGKRSAADFALWKLSKPGEPSWPSPWGDGRPGWHIECSAMASDKLGRSFDIHSGGIDLAFPHHDNELAQSEAYWSQPGCACSDQWVNYFIHMGHLSIAGAKMSKSLKNFTTIREALARGDWTSRSLRILILLGSWRDGIEITEEIVKASTSWEEKVNNFFVKIKDRFDDGGEAVLERLSLASRTSTSKTNNEEVSTMLWPYDNDYPLRPGSLPRLDAALEKAKSNTFMALCDSFDTCAVMGIISDLITTYNSEAAQSTSDSIVDIARWVTAMLRMLGLDSPRKITDPSLGWSGLDIPQAQLPILKAISSMRDRLRFQALAKAELSVATLQEVLTDMATIDARFGMESDGKDTKPFFAIFEELKESLKSMTSKFNHDSSQVPSKVILAECDRVREQLFPLSVYLEDRDAPDPALLRVVTREMVVLRREKEEKERMKEQLRREREAEATKKLEAGKLRAQDMFRTQDYSAWDEEGIPLRDAQGQEVTKSRVKKLRKDWERQKKMHDAWVQATRPT